MTDPCTVYAIDVVEGRRTVGAQERLACRRHLDDLKRSESEDFPYRFDEAKAERIYTWFSYCKHLEGPKAGTPIILEPFQKFDLGCIFGWVWKETGYRRYQKALVMEARKNGKSITCSGIGLYLMCGDGEETPQVYCAAVDRGQAGVIYDAAQAMAYKSPDIAKRLKIRNYKISHMTRGGKMIPLSADTKNKDGFNPSGALIDEYHAHPTSQIYDLIWSAWGQRSQALMMIITTAGFETVENPCYKEYEYCKSILNRAILNERYFVMIRELDPDDDEHDPANWIKANPLRASTPEGLARLKEQHDEAFNSGIPEKVRNFRVKNLNRFVNETESSYMGERIQKWRALGKLRDEFLAITKGKKAIVGVDLSKSVDLTAVAYLFVLEDKKAWTEKSKKTQAGKEIEVEIEHPAVLKVAIAAHGFLPEASLVQHEKTDKIPYRDWSREGWLTITEGEVTDYKAIKDYIEECELGQGWKMHEFAFDPYNATMMANELQREGVTIVQIRQGVQTLSEPTKRLRDLVASGDVTHDGNPLLTWCLENAREVQDNNENIKLSKKNASDTKRIDLAAAAINALVRLDALREACRDVNAEIKAGKWGM
jgi:phage terminase large subunit-like protein